MEPFRDDNDLIAELRAQRPAPRPAFAAKLDERAAAGFPRQTPDSSSPLARALARLRALPPRRLALTGGAIALASIVAATTAIAINDSQSDSSSLALLSPTDRPAPIRPSGQASNSESSGVQYETEIPTTAGPVIAHGGEAPSSSGSTGAASSPFRGSEKEVTGSYNGNASYAPDMGPFAYRAHHRDVERSAEMVLGADPADVASDAGQVFDAVHAADGIVLSSSVRGGGAGAAGARFDLLIPAAKLSDALAAFSAIDVVVSRHEATDDITAPTVRLGERLRDSRAKIDSLVVQLASAKSDDERAGVEVEVAAERRHAASLRSRATKLDRRSNLSRVSLRIETDAAPSAPGESGGWGIGDALHDAGHILVIAAGVIVIGLAILGPLALIAFLIWLANRARIRRGRERALV